MNIHPALFFLGLVALTGLGGAAGHYLDPDRGGYVDSFATTATFSDKFVHALAGACLWFVFVPLAGDWRAVIMVAVVGGAFELGQAANNGFGSWRDWIADVVGAGVALGWYTTMGVFG